MKGLVFYSSVHPLTRVMLITFPMGLFALVIFIFSEGNLEIGDLFASLLMLAAAIFLVWILVDTKYRIQNETVLHYNTGPIRGRIDIQSIRKIEYQYGWVSKSLLKASLDKNGLYLYYNKFDDLYVSPKDKEAFVNYLLKINPKIEII
jgi:hypothetical protein